MQFQLYVQGDERNTHFPLLISRPFWIVEEHHIQSFSTMCDRSLSSVYMSCHSILPASLCVCNIGPTEPAFVFLVFSLMYCMSLPLLQCRQQNPRLPGSHKLSWAQTQTVQSNIRNAIWLLPNLLLQQWFLFSPLMWTYRTSKDLNITLLRRAFTFSEQEKKMCERLSWLFLFLSCLLLWSRISSCAFLWTAWFISVQNPCFPAKQREHKDREYGNMGIWDVVRTCLCVVKM